MTTRQLHDIAKIPEDGKQPSYAKFLPMKTNITLGLMAFQKNMEHRQWNHRCLKSQISDYKGTRWFEKLQKKLKVVEDEQSGN
ncbi:hypothetical protein B9Z55_007369 [Caenorhabditis nigoni]|uniref:Uncharacterized protein n=1 Tax=Caenorhabditis nigoni TaxID=1611254 RepID=A0A2G5VA14_9PELO|nr:hypothetical protein B9Z55_007369 [Caenorhabditis nigoni]